MTSLCAHAVRLLYFVAQHRRAVIAAIRSDRRPPLSNICYGYDRPAGLIRISVTADRAKSRNLQRDPRVSLHVTSPDFWTWVVVEGTAELTPIATDPHDATVEELVDYYRQAN